MDAFVENWTDFESISKSFWRIGLVIHMEELLCYWRMNWNWTYHDSNPSMCAIWNSNPPFRGWCFSPCRGCMPGWDLLLTASVRLLAFLVHGENWPEVTSFFFVCYQVMNKLVLLSTLRPRSIFCSNVDCFSEWKWTGKMPSRRFAHWQMKHLHGWMKRPLIEIKSSICIVVCHLQAFAHISNSHNYPIKKAK